MRQPKTSREKKSAKRTRSGHSRTGPAPACQSRWPAPAASPPSPPAGPRQSRPNPANKKTGKLVDHFPENKNWFKFNVAHS